MKRRDLLRGVLAAAVLPMPVCSGPTGARGCLTDYGAVLRRLYPVREVPTPSTPPCGSFLALLPEWRGT